MRKSGVEKRLIVAVSMSLISLFLLSSIAYADINPISTWAKTYRGSDILSFATSIQQTSDGGYIVAGDNLTYGSYKNVYVLKLDANGNEQWSKTFSSNNNAYIYLDPSIYQTTDGGYILTFYSTSYRAGANADVFVVRLDSIGNVEWQNIYGGQGDDIVTSVQQTSDGGYIIAGLTRSFSISYWYWYHAWVLKLNSGGDIQWQKVYSDSNRWAYLYEWVSSIQQTSDGGYIVAGAAYYHALIMKLDASGNVVWQKIYGGDREDLAYSVQQTSDGGFIVLGGSFWYVGGEYPDMWVLKTDSAGNTLWQKSFNDFYQRTQWLHPIIQQTKDSGYIMGGTSRRTGALMFKLDSDGNISWQKAYYNGGIFSIRQALDEGYIVGGYTGDMTLVLKLDTNGNINGCAASLIQNSNITSVNVIMDEKSIDLKVTETSASPQMSNAIVADTHVIPGTMCVETQPNISINPLTLNFGSVELPGSSTLTITISNTGDADLTISGINIAGTNATEFSQTNNCSTVAPNASCTVTVTFTPTSLGAKSATLIVSSNDPDTPTVNIPLTGTGVDTTPPTVSIAASPSLLWPPNHKMVDVVIGGSATDSGSGVDSVVITVADEYGVYNMTVPGFGSTIQLEAWREGTDRDGRHYTITAVVTDKAGNQSTAVTGALVPHDMR